MAWSKQDRIITHDKLVAMLPSVRKHLMKKFPSIISIDVGIKEVNGKLKEEFAFRIHLKEKKALSELKSSEIIPKEIKGIQTDVHKARIFKASGNVDNFIPDENSYSPLWGGVQLKFGGGSGTLGCFVKVKGDTKIHLLSNHHVIMSVKGKAGDLIGHPGAATEDCCCCDGSSIAKVVAGKVGVLTPPAGDPNIVDAAYAILQGQTAGDAIKVLYTNKIISIGPIFGSATPVPGSKVRKRGRTTRYTEGTIKSCTLTATVTYHEKKPEEYDAVYSNQVDINQDAGFDCYLAKGDSGSVTVNTLNQVVGLNFAGDAATGTGAANCIDDVLNVAGWNLEVLSSGTVGAIPISGMQADAIPAARPSTFVQRMEAKLKQTPNGQGMLDIINQNKSEVLDLINDNREVKVAWNRYQGPHFIGHLAKNAREKNHPIPKELNGYSFQNLLIKMSDVLERNGSYQLAQSIEDYSLSVFNFADEYNGLDSMDNLLDKYEFCPNCGQMNKTKNYA